MDIFSWHIDPVWVYYPSAVLLVLVCVAAWLTTLLTLPGNWAVGGLAGGVGGGSAGPPRSPSAVRWCGRGGGGGGGCAAPGRLSHFPPGPANPRAAGHGA